MRVGFIFNQKITIFDFFSFLKVSILKIRRGMVNILEQLTAGGIQIKLLKI